MKNDFGKKLENLNERYLNGDLSRRDFLRYLGIAGAAVGLVGGPFAPLMRSARAAKSIRFDSWGGVVSEAYVKYAFEDFTRETGIEVISGEFGDMDTYLTRVKASFPPGGEFNLANLSGVFDYARYIGLGFGVVLDESKIPNLKPVMPVLLKAYRGISNGTLSAVPYTYGQTGIGYNTKYISKDKAEKLGAALLWDKDLKGKLGSWGDWRTNIWYGALYTKQHPNDIKDMEAVWNALREQQKMVKKYWGSGAELMSLLANEEIYATVAWSGRVAALQKQGHPIGFLSPSNCYSWMECIFVLKGTDMDAAHQLLNFLLEPKCAIAVSEACSYPISLDPTRIEMSEAVKKLPAFDPTGKLEGYLFAKPDYWNGHQVEWAEKWDRVMSGA
jgi:spermidine/putrescine transport system substrate-binding protein